VSATSGYSGTPLAKKLGLKDGQRVGFVDLPDTLGDLATARVFSSIARVGAWSKLANGPFDYLHLFTKSAAELEQAVPALQDRMDRDGILWVSWPKKAAKVETDVTGDVVRAEVLRHKLVDIKVCAVDEVWSGLKMMIRKELRARHRGLWEGEK